LLCLLLPTDLGVPIFFVLSGYLIGGILLRTLSDTAFSTRDLWRFWMRRWLRTLPNYFLVLGFLVLYDILVYRVDWNFWWSYLFFLQNLATPNPVFFPESWSLSVEEWFYLSFPFCCWAGLKLGFDKKKVILLLAVFFIVLPSMMRLYAYLTDAYPDIWVTRSIVVYQLDGLMYGVLGAYTHRYAPGLWSKVRMPGLCVGIALLVLLFAGKPLLLKGSALPVYFPSLASVMTLAVLPYFSMLRSIGSKSWTSVFTFVSLISYAMYVLNLSVLQWRIIPAFLSVTGLNSALGADGAAVTGFVLFWPALLIGSYLLYRYFETPWMNMRDRIAYLRT
jgi:peptidoglycan/LPS O-acetylase OafA/YrhL